MNEHMERQVGDSKVLLLAAVEEPVKALVEELVEALVWVLVEELVTAASA